jgi:hypothetical protein
MVVNVFLVLTQLGFCGVYFVFLGSTFASMTNSTFSLSLSTSLSLDLSTSRPLDLSLPMRLSSVYLLSSGELRCGGVSCECMQMCVCVCVFSYDCVMVNILACVCISFVSVRR